MKLFRESFDMSQVGSIWSLIAFHAVFLSFAFSKASRGGVVGTQKKPFVFIRRVMDSHEFQTHNNNNKTNLVECGKASKPKNKKTNFDESFTRLRCRVVLG